MKIINYIMYGGCILLHLYYFFKGDKLDSIIFLLYALLFSTFAKLINKNKIN